MSFANKQITINNKLSLTRFYCLLFITYPSGLPKGAAL